MGRSQTSVTGFTPVIIHQQHGWEGLLGVRSGPVLWCSDRALFSGRQVDSLWS